MTAEIILVGAEDEWHQLACADDLRIQLQFGKIRLIQMRKELLLVHTTRVADEDSLCECADGMGAKDEANWAKLHSAARLVMITVPICGAPIEEIEQVLVKDLALSGLQFVGLQDQLENLATRRVD